MPDDKPASKTKSTTADVLLEEECQIEEVEAELSLSGNSPKEFKALE